METCDICTVALFHDDPLKNKGVPLSCLKHKAGAVGNRYHSSGFATRGREKHQDGRKCAFLLLLALEDRRELSEYL